MNIKYIEIPSICPICGADTEIIKEYESEVLMCTNDNCKGKLLGKLVHFCSKNAINIEGMSEATLKFLIDKGWIKSFKDIYKINYYRQTWKEYDGFGDKSVDKLLEAIEKSRNTELSRFIYALSIPLIGRSASKEIAKVCHDDIDVFLSLIKSKDLYKVTSKIDGFGDAMYNSLCSYCKLHMSGIEGLANEFVFKKEDTNVGKVDLSGKIFVITGSLIHYKNRDELVGIIEKFGGKVSGSVSSKTSYLINNNVESTSGKNKKAKELGIPIITEEEFIKIITN